MSMSLIARARAAVGGTTISFHAITVKLSTMLVTSSGFPMRDTLMPHDDIASTSLVRTSEPTPSSTASRDAAGNTSTSHFGIFSAKYAATSAGLEL